MQRSVRGEKEKRAMGKGGVQLGRYLCEPRAISQRQDRIPFKQPLPKMEIGHREKKPITCSPPLR